MQRLQTAGWLILYTCLSLIALCISGFASMGVVDALGRVLTPPEYAELNTIAVPDSPIYHVAFYLVATLVFGGVLGVWRSWWMHRFADIVWQRTFHLYVVLALLSPLVFLAFLMLSILIYGLGLQQEPPPQLALLAGSAFGLLSGALIALFEQERMQIQQKMTHHKAWLLAGWLSWFLWCSGIGYLLGQWFAALD